MNDPYAILEVQRGASLKEVAAAWRRKAKEWHPDLRGDANAIGRMVQINAAYEQILDERTGRGSQTATPRGPAAEDEAARAAGTDRARGPGWWLEPAQRIALGPELLHALRPGERVHHIVPCEAGGSAALLAVTDRRLLWLLDDHVLGRVRSMPLTAIATVDRPPSRPWRRSDAVRVRGGGRRVTFGGLTAGVAERVLGELAKARPAAVTR